MITYLRIMIITDKQRLLDEFLLIYNLPGKVSRRLVESQILSGDQHAYLIYPFTHKYSVQNGDYDMNISCVNSTSSTIFEKVQSRVDIIKINTVC